MEPTEYVNSEGGSTVLKERKRKFYFRVGDLKILFMIAEENLTGKLKERKTLSNLKLAEELFSLGHCL